MHRNRRVLLILLIVGLCACDRDVTDPAFAGEDVDALLARAGLSPAPGDYTLGSLLHDAIRITQREHGTEAARLQLERIRAAAPAASELPDSTARGQLAIVLETLGGDLLGPAEAAVAARLDRLGALADSLGKGAGGPLATSQAQAAVELTRARSAVEGGDTLGGLLALTRAAALASDLRHELLARRRVESLPELFAQVRSQIEAREGVAAERLAQHHALSADARAALERRRAGPGHRALEALRNEEIRLTLEALGPGTAARVVRDVEHALAEVDVSSAQARVKRMHAAAHDLAVRARRELERGRPAVALDLASHAAGLTNALILAVSLR